MTKLRNRVPGIAILGLLSCFNIPATAAEDCGAVGDNVKQGAKNFLVDDLTASVAWVKDGQRGNTFYLLDDCNTLFGRRPQRLYFMVNNAFVPSEGDGKASFVAVQILKLQEKDQTELVTIERNDNDWTRDSAKQLGFRSVVVAGMAPAKFMDLHKVTPFDDGSLKNRTTWWHAALVEGPHSSFEHPEKWNWQELVPLITSNSNRAILSNRLYGFNFNPDGNTGVKFEVGIKGATEVHIRVFSPIWPERESQHIIKFQ